MATLDDAVGVVESLPFKVYDSFIIGSSYIFGEGQDVDILCHVGSDLMYKHDVLKDRGWSTHGHEFYAIDEDLWFSAKKGKVNLLITSSEEHFAAMKTGARICKALAVEGKLPQHDKWMRVIIHRVLTGEDVGTNPFQ